MIGRTIAFILRASGALASRCRNIHYRALGCQIDGYAWLRSIRIPRQWADIHLEKGVALDEGVVLLASGPPSKDKIQIGEGVYINRNSIIDASQSLKIGSETMIGPGCYITDHDHEFPAGEAPGTGGLLNAPTVIGKRAWLGAGVIVLKGVSIGDGAIVGAGCVVTRDIPENAIAVGNPARVIRTREF